MADVARFDPKTKQLESLTQLPEPRSSHDAVVIGDKLYVAGGWQPGVIVEEERGGWTSVFVPDVPAAKTGRLFCLPAEQVRRLDVPLDDFRYTITESGRGSQDWLEALSDAEAGTLTE